MNNVAYPILEFSCDSKGARLTAFHCKNCGTSIVKTYHVWDRAANRCVLCDKKALKPIVQVIDIKTKNVDYV